jgi:hypothetical protein
LPFSLRAKIHLRLNLSKRTSGAKALICGLLCGTAEAVPFQNAPLFGRLGGSEYCPSKAGSDEGGSLDDCGRWIAALNVAQVKAGLDGRAALWVTAVDG